VTNRVLTNWSSRDVSSQPAFFMKNAGGVRLPLPLAFGQFLGSLGVGVGKAARQRWAMMQTESTVPTRAWPAYGYLASILNNAECPAMIIGGVADHVHILFELSRQACVAGLVGDLKASSSKWLKAQGVAGFAWQRGYGCFSVSRSNVSKARSYIAEQPSIIRCARSKMSCACCYPGMASGTMKDIFGTSALSVVALFQSGSLRCQNPAAPPQASVVLRFQRQKGTPRAYPGPAFFMKNAAYPSAAKISGIGPTDVAPSVSLECR
jgi:hypothetical protein